MTSASSKLVARPAAGVAPIVALPVETKVRELEGKCWLAVNLARRGWRVALG